MRDSATPAEVADNRDLANAASVHYSFLPAPIDNDYVDLAVRYQPVQTLGGDFCSAFWVNDKQLILCMCDVTGHGIASALYAARINSFVLAHAASSAHPCDLLVRLNAFLIDNLGDVGLYSTFFSACVDLESMELTYANAAHPPPLCYSPHTGDARTLDSETTLLGVGRIATNRCQHRSMPLHSGDKLVIYTDGLIERVDANGIGDGIQRLRRFAVEHAPLGSDEFNARLVAFSLTEWGVPHDDLLTMTLRLK